MVKTVHIDKYARDAGHWRTRATIAYEAARILFTHEKALMLCFEAAPVAHHALELFLKTALINEGYTIFNPDKVGQLDRSVKLDKTDCAWAHNLVDLAKLLAATRPEFDLSAELIVPWYVPIRGPLTIESAFAMFDPFFSSCAIRASLKNWTESDRTMCGCSMHSLRFWHPLSAV